MTVRSGYIGQPRRRSYVWRWVLVLVATVAVLFLILAFPFGLFMTAGFPEQPPPVVSTVVVEEMPWQPTVEAVGSLSPSQGADLAFEVAGVVDEVYFEAGGEVAASAPLVRLRSTDENARLRTLEAAAELAAATHQRNLRLLEIQGISTQEIEQSEAALTSARAQVAEQRAIIEKKVVRAPFAGRVGIRRANVGQYVNPGTAVTTLQDFDPIYFDFYVPQQTLNRVRVGQNISIHVDAYPDAAFEGKIDTIDPKVDIATRNVAIRAIIDNADFRLLPGMYATAVIEAGGEQRLLTVPQTAVTYNPYGNTVYRVDEQPVEGGEPHLVATQTFVTTGETRGDQIAILSGIEAGDTIVSAGQFKLQNGATIEVNNEVQPANEPNPRPLQR